MQKAIISVDHLVDALGGPTKVGEWLGINQSAVSMWKIRGEIPPGWHLRIYLEAEARGFSLSERVFGYEVADIDRSAASKKKTQPRERARASA